MLELGNSPRPTTRVCIDIIPLTNCRYGNSQALQALDSACVLRLSLCLSASVSVSLPLSLSLSVCLSVSLCLSLSLSLSVSLCLSLSLSLSLRLCLCVCVRVCARSSSIHIPDNSWYLAWTSVYILQCIVGRENLRWPICRPLTENSMAWFFRRKFTVKEFPNEQ